MKAETKDNLDLAPREERALLDQIRNDHDLIARLSITPQELEALSKCALLGTLTCKQDMLFILRQIREATSSTIDHTILFPQPPAVNGTEEKIPSRAFAKSRFGWRRRSSLSRIRVTPSCVGGFRSESACCSWWWRCWRRFGMERRARHVPLARRLYDHHRHSGQPGRLSSDAWYDRFDHLETLLFWEVLSWSAVATVVYLKSQRDSRRFKVRPGQRLR